MKVYQKMLLEMRLSLLGKVIFNISSVLVFVSTAVSANTVNILSSILAITLMVYSLVQGRSRNYGTVVNKLTGFPVPGIRVDLKNPKYPQLSGVSQVTNKYGRYSFLVDKGQYQLVAYRKDTQTNTLTPVYKSDIIDITSPLGHITNNVTV